MDILIIGGTKFVGRALSETIVKRGHNLTLFHRGETNPDFMPEEDRIKGDRETDLEKLGGRNWDAVIDTCAYVPRITKLSVDYLKDQVKKYVFVSSISVYTESDELNRDENADLIDLEDKTTEDVMGSSDSYGGLKVLCENEVINTFEDNTVIVRPGLIVGPNDPSNRFTYWPVRIKKGGDILAPGDGSFPLQFIDVRDLADFTISLLEKDKSGIFNATGPNQPIPLKQFFQTCKEITGSNAKLHWADNDWLTAQKVGPWMEMPLWIPSRSGAALMQVSIQKAIDNGMKFRPITDTIIDTIDWYNLEDGDSKEWPAGLTPDREIELLSKLG